MTQDHQLPEIARWVRREALLMVGRAGRGHIGGSLSCVEILVALYLGGLLSIDPRDRFIMSKGHAVEALYPVLARAGFFPEDWLKTYGQNGSRLGGHPDRSIPGVSVSTGSLGHGLAIGAGMAMAAKMDGEQWNTVVLMGDGECYEGSVWEAARFASERELEGLTAIIDHNGLMTLGPTDLGNLKAKWEAFGWYTLECDGHHFPDLRAAMTARSFGRPKAIVAYTVKGKGVSFMEGHDGWHHSVPDEAQMKQALEELNTWT